MHTISLLFKFLIRGQHTCAKMHPPPLWNSTLHLALCPAFLPNSYRRHTPFSKLHLLQKQPPRHFSISSFEKMLIINKTKFYFWWQFTLKVFNMCLLGIEENFRIGKKCWNICFNTHIEQTRKLQLEWSAGWLAMPPVTSPESHLG